jgi:alpha-D-xyloside xylohydrolase
VILPSPFFCQFSKSFLRPLIILFSAALLVICASVPLAHAEDANLVLHRGNSTIVFEPYAPNIIRVTLSLKEDKALAAPGYGFLAKPAPESWAHQQADAGDEYRSSRISVTVAADRHSAGPPPLTVVDISKFFNGSTPGAHITIRTTEGKKLLEMTGWSMSVPNNKDGNAGILRDRRPGDDEFFQVGASFVSPDDEHYYGLGQNQEGYLDHRGHTVQCWHNYTAAAAPSVCVPFLVTNYGYGLVWDNPSRTTIEPGFNEQTRWTSEVGNRVSFFVIAGKNYDEIYSGYRLLTGVTPMLPKAAYGFVQCKQRYLTQEEMLNVARGYRERHLPLDVLVLDWFYYSKMGQMDFVPERFPDPAAMNKQLHDMGIQTMISVWPRFTKESRYYDTVLKNGWFEHLADGTPTNGLPYDRAGSDIDTSNPDAAKWYWGIIRDNIISKGFDSLWADETEPDLPPNGSYFHAGPGTQYFNIYPLVHTGALYEGFRRDVKHRALILSRDAYLGSQRNGTLMWSSDISPTWDAYKRQIPTGLNFTASGMAYWTNDVGGWQYLPGEHRPKNPPLLDPSDARENVGGYDDYPELFTRWFEYGTFLPVMRTHGSRKWNEVWSYGKQAEPILEKYLKLRYELMPYIYSLGYSTHETGAPFMRPLFMDFPDDFNVINMTDEYMFGPAFLVAPVTEQGMTIKNVYLPAGSDWYNYWTNERYHGGQIAKVDAPIDIIPLFVRAGSIIPTGTAIESTAQKQEISKIRVYPGADTDFTLYSDDGTSYGYEKGEFKATHLHWDDSTQKLTHDGAPAWSSDDRQIIEVVKK